MNLDRVGWEGVDWTNVAHKWDQCRAIVNKVMNF
jgi:hypothetical protein